MGNLAPETADQMQFLKAQNQIESVVIFLMQNESLVQF
jgi:hypothetical protein